MQINGPGILQFSPYLLIDASMQLHNDFFFILGDQSEVCFE